MYQWFTPLCCWIVFLVEYTTISLTNHPSKDIWADPSFWLLQIELLWAFLCRLLDMHSSSLPAFRCIPVVLGVLLFSNAAHCFLLLPPAQIPVPSKSCGFVAFLLVSLSTKFRLVSFSMDLVLTFFCFSVSAQRDWKLMLRCPRASQNLHLGHFVFKILYFSLYF